MDEPTLTRPSEAAPGGGRCGAALVVVVLMMLAVMALAHGMLLSSRTELAASGAGARQLELQAGAVGAVALTLAAPAAAWMDSVPLWEARPVVTARFGRVDALGALRRLEREAWLVEGSARIGDGPPARSGALVWHMDPVARVAELEGVLSVDTGAVVTLDGPVDGMGFTRVEVPLTGSMCEPWAPRLDSIVPRNLPPASWSAVAAGGPHLGLLRFDSLVARVEVSVAGSGTAEPVERLGQCETGLPWNWGDPDNPARPCGGHLALRSARGDVRVEGGSGQGILIVEGDVTFASGARYYGLVLGSGRLRLEGGALLTGAAFAAGGAHVAAGARVRGSACWVARVLAAHRGMLGRAIPLDGAAVGPL